MNAMMKPAPSGTRVDKLDPKAIVAAQQAAGVPESLLRMQMRPSMMMAGAVGDREYLDGMVLAQNTFNLVALDGASGKSTSSRGSGVFAADSGLWNMFGTRQHSAPLKVVLIHGEETEEEVVQSFRTIPGAEDAYWRAVASGRLIVISMQDYQQRMDRPESVFDKEGRFTNYGRELFGTLREYKPDVLVLDTLTSLADTEYLDSLSPRNTINELNKFCAQTRCTGIGYLHFTKDAGSRVKADSSASELLSLSRGSAMLKNISRSFIVATRAPAEMFGIEAKKSDQVWVGTTKCNLQGAAFNHKTFPIIRDSTKMVLSAQVGNQSLADDVAERNSEILRDLRDMLPRLIQAGSERRKPFVRKSSSEYSLEKMSLGALITLFPRGCTPKLVSQALAELVRDGVVIECSATRSAAGNVYETPGGVFSDEEAYEAMTGEKLKIFRGSVPPADFETRIEELAQDKNVGPTALDSLRSEAEIAAAQQEKDAKLEAEQLRRDAERARQVFGELKEMLPRMIRAGACLRKPFSANPKSDSSLQATSGAAYSALFPSGSTPHLIDLALAELVREGAVLECSMSRNGSGAVYDVPAGPFADPEAYEAMTGDKVKIFPGAVSADDLKTRMHDLDDLDENEEEDEI